MRILHVTDCFHGGVAAAVTQYARLTPEHDHLLLSNNARSCEPPLARTPGVFAVDEALPESPAAAVRSIRCAAADLHPDVIHAHSSFAGAYVRLASAMDRITAGRTSVPVIYTPHSFAFERADIPRWQRWAFRLLEKALYPLTTVAAPCAQWEGELMKDLGHRLPGTVPVVVVPNVLSADHPATPVSWTPPAHPVVGVVGRVTPQRDPAFFIGTAALIRRSRPDTEFVWIGAGDGKDTSLSCQLTDAGIDITGWLSGEALYRRIAELSLVVHTARWDGFPMSVLEVRRIGTPLLVRDIPALRECPESSRFRTVEDAADKAEAILDDGPDPTDWDALDRAHTPELQRDRLTAAYDLAVGRTPNRKAAP